MITVALPQKNAKVANLPASEKASRLFIDCDPGHDDALAIMLAHARAEIMAITTVSGNAPLEAVTRNALAIVELLGADVPVHAGAAGPLVGEPLHAPHVHGTSGLGGTSLPEPRGRLASADAVEFLLEETKKQPGCWIVAIGPLTNVAQALSRDPALAERIRGVSIMGGSTTVGNATAKAEFNVLADPEAAAQVLAAPVPLKLCGLNLTHQLRSDDALLAELRAARNARAAFAADVLAYLHERMAVIIGERRSALHDPCAVLAVTDPELFEFRRRHVAVELHGKLTRGMTVVDERVGTSSQAPNVDVAYGIDAAAALAALQSSLGVAPAGGRGD